MCDCCDSSDASLMLAMLLAMLLAIMLCCLLAVQSAQQLSCSTVSSQLRDQTDCFRQGQFKVRGAWNIKYGFCIFYFSFIKDAIFSEVIFYQCSICKDI